MRQRLRLGAVSPKLMTAYRDDALTLDQLMAFALSEDDERQEQVSACSDLTAVTMSESKTQEQTAKVLGVPTDVRHPDHEYSHGRYVKKGAKDCKDLRVLNGVEFVRGQDEEDPHGFVPIAAWTSSYARCFMWDMIHLAGIDNVSHVATDSLLVNGVGLGRLQLHGYVEDGEIGKFRVEGSTDHCVVKATNVVDFGDIKKRPGVKEGAVNRGEEIWEVEEWSGFTEDVFAGVTDRVTIDTILLGLALAANRRELAADGSTRPWRIVNWALTPEEQSDAPIERHGLGEIP